MDAFRARKGRKCQTVEESVPCWVVEQGATGNCAGNGGCKFFRISGAYGTETPNSGRIGALLGVVEEGAFQAPQIELFGLLPDLEKMSAPKL